MDKQKMVNIKHEMRKIVTTMSMTDDQDKKNELWHKYQELDAELFEAMIEKEVK